MSIAYKSQGAGAGTETNGATLNLPCPATVDANDILVAHVLHTGTGTEPSTPSGWTFLYGPANVGTTATARHWAFGKIADGSEDGATVSFGTAGGTQGRAGRIYSFSGYISGTIAQIIPAASFSSVPHATDPQGPSVTTTLVGALAVALTCQDDNNTEEAIAGASGGTWSGFQTFVDTALGPQGLHIDIQVATPTANPGTISGGATVAVNDEAGTIGFEIRPVGIPVTADYGPYKTVVDGGASAWDSYFENVSCVVKFGSTYFLYYIGGDTDADEGDDWVYNRQIGVATSPDMVNWTKYGSNPILSFTPEGDQDEEGIGDCKCVVYDGKIHMYYSAIRWRSGGDVDVEIRYRESTNGFTFTNDTLIIDDLDEELYSSGVYVTSGGTFHLYYVGPLAGGVGDLKKLSGSDPTSLSSDGTITTNDYSSRGGIVPLDADNLLLFNDRFFDGSITCTLIKTSALGTLSTVFTAINFGGSGLELPGCFFYENGQWFCFSTIGTSAAAPFDATQIILRTAPDMAEFELAASSNIAASAATATTAIMSAPAGKDTGDFDPGWISDDTNPGPSTDIDTDLYTELEWCLQATAYAGPGVTYEFRVSDNGTALDSYTDLPEWTIEAGPIEQAIGQTTESDTALSLAKTKKKAIGLATETDLAQAVTEATAIEQAIGLTTETDTVQAFAAVKQKAVGLNAETEAAQALTARKARAVGLSSATETALGLTMSKAKAFGQASEADLAQSLSKVKATSLGLATETAQGFDLHTIKARVLGLTTETETAQDLTVQGATLVGQTTETDQALALSTYKSLAIGQTQETDAALSATRQKTKATGLTTETDQAFSVSATKSKIIGLVTETGTAQGMAVQGSTLLGLADETEAALSLSVKKAKTLGLASEAESAQALTGRKVRTIGLVTETDQALGVGNAISLVQVVETDSGLPLRAIKTRVLGLAQETSMGLPAGPQKYLAMGLVTEAQAALALYIEPTVGPVLVRVGATLSIPGHENETLSIPEHAGELLNIPEQSGATLTV